MNLELNSSKLISRKIHEIEKFLNFHSVQAIFYKENSYRVSGTKSWVKTPKITQTMAKTP